MSKVIILGTDLHGQPTELASKTVRSLKPKIQNHKILSIQNRKKREKQKNTSVISRISRNNKIRKLFQSFALPIYLLILRMFGYSNIFTFWVANSYYHKLLFKFLKLIRYKIIFTVISGEANLSVLKECDKVICQSDSMKKRISKSIPSSKIKIIYPSINLKKFKPSKKTNTVLIPSVPYDVRDFSERGIDKILEFLKKSKLSSIIIFRSDSSYEYVMSQKIQNAKLINKQLSDKELSKITSTSRIIPLLYMKNAPDMPLSAIEGLASGCTIICLNNLGVSDIVQKEKAGIVIKAPSQLNEAIKSVLRNNNYNKNARKTAGKYFKEKNINSYLELI